MVPTPSLDLVGGVPIPTGLVSAAVLAGLDPPGDLPGCPPGTQPPIFIPFAEIAANGLPAIVGAGPPQFHGACDEVGGPDCCAYAFRINPLTHVPEWVQVGSAGGCSSNCGFPCVAVDVYFHNFFAGLDPCTGQPLEFPHVACNYIAWTIASCDGTSTGPGPCVVPCWLSCAPASVQSAYCSFVKLVNETCTFTGLAECLATLAEEEINPTAAALCFAELTAACGASVLGGLLNLVIGWLGLNPFGCPGCTTTPPSGCPDGQYPPPCNRHPGDTLMADSGCCDPPAELTPLQRSGAMTAVLRLPIPTSAIAPTACGGCSRPTDAELEELEEEF